MIRHVPNLITFARILAVPLMVWLILKNEMRWAFWLFVAAGISDAIDGFIAKRFDAETKIGAFLDPLADKALLICSYVFLGVEGFLPAWLVILVVFRDVLIVGGAILYQLLTSALTMHPLMISKVNTASQIILIAVLLADLGLMLDVRWAVDALVWVVGATTLLSGVAYVWTWGRRAIMMEDDAT